MMTFRPVRGLLSRRCATFGRSRHHSGGHARCGIGRARRSWKKAVAAYTTMGATQAETLRYWGWFERFDVGSRFQVKRIVFHPGCGAQATKPSPPVRALDCDRRESLSNRW